MDGDSAAAISAVIIILAYAATASLILRLLLYRRLKIFGLSVVLLVFAQVH